MRLVLALFVLTRHIFLSKNLVHMNLKPVSAIFSQIFIFSPNDSSLKTAKNVCYFI